MRLTKDFLDELRYMYGQHIDKDLERSLLAEYEEEPFPYEYSEQDLREQIRKRVYQYQQGTLDVTVKSPKVWLMERYEGLKEQHLEILSENACLKDDVGRMEKVLKEHGLLKQDDK